MHDEGPAMVSARGVVVRVGARSLLDGVDLEARRGQMVGLIGPNGAGKTTLLRAIAGVLPVQGGAIALDGVDLGTLSARDTAAMVAMTPQTMPYTYGFTALELVLMGRYPHLGRFQLEGQADLRIAREAMRLTETDHLADRTLDTLSGGERQRVIVARALAQRPRALLLDEPTSNLDVLHQLQVLGLVRRLVDEGLTAIAAIHDLSLAARFCHRLAALHEGRLLAEGTPEEVLTPSTIAAAFGVEAVPHRDAHTGALTVTLIGPAR